uniref:BESS domain-containing protein n=2 Tax=Lygus hesperus TaxID=30085 RepID=A0A146LCR5_LYGHE
MDRWGVVHRVFALDEFLKNGESVVAVQRAFRIRFNIGRHGTVPSRNTLMRWVTSFRSTGSVMKKKPPGPARTATTEENVERVREAVLQSPGRSVRQRAQSLHISPASFNRIIKSNLKVAATRKPRKKRIIESEFIENDPLALDDEPMIDIPSGSGSGGCIVVKQEPTGEEFTDPLSIGQLETLARTENYGEIPKFIPLKSETDATQGDVVPLDLEEDDLLYFKSLAPDLAYLTPDLKEVFRIKVRNILKELSIQ